VDILVRIAPEVYGPYVSTNKAGQKVLMMAALFYYKKIVKSLTKQGIKVNPYDGCLASKDMCAK
jgi:hypothetical protein